MQKTTGAKALGAEAGVGQPRNRQVTSVTGPKPASRGGGEIRSEG